MSSSSPRHHWTTSLPVLTGRLIELKEVTRSDVQQLHDYLSDPRVYQYVNRPPTDVTGITKWVELMHARRREGLLAGFAVWHQPTARLIGVAQIVVGQGQASTEWGWSLTPSMWGTGAFLEVASLLLRFAHQHLGADRVVATVQVENARARQALRKLGSELIASEGSSETWATGTTLPAS